MKFCSLILVIITLSANAQVKNDMPKEKINGKIKTMRETEHNLGKHYLIHYNRFAGTTITSYANNGNETEVETLDKNGISDYKIVYSYDANNNRVACDDYHKSLLETRSAYKYDDKGYQVEQDDYDAASNKLTKKHTFKYDASGHQVEFDSWEADGSLEFKSVNSFDNNGNVTEEQYFDGSNNLEFKLAYTYDTNGNEQVLTYYKPDGSVEFKLEYKYENVDKNGNWLKETTLKNGKTINIIERAIEYY